MSFVRKRLAEFFRRYARGRSKKTGKEFADEVRRVLSVQAPTRTTASGRIVATTPATPFAPPRKVSGKLLQSVKITETTNGIRVRVGVSYGMPLEFSHRFPGFPHKFFEVAARNIGLSLRTRYD